MYAALYCIIWLIQLTQPSMHVTKLSLCNTILHYLTQTVKHSLLYAALYCIIRLIQLTQPGMHMSKLSLCNNILHYLTHPVKHSLLYAVLYCIILLIQSNTAYCMQHYTALSDSLVNTDWYVYDNTTIYATQFVALYTTFL